jgi:hypothetical protein
MALYAYNLYKAIDKFRQVQEVTAKILPGLIEDKHYYEYYVDVLTHSTIQNIIKYTV